MASEPKGGTQGRTGAAGLQRSADDETIKRAICLGGGGPVLGLHIGALKGLMKRGIDFRQERDVWALSCIGAWVGILFNQADRDKEIDQTYDFFHAVYRDDESYRSFPMNTIFAPDWAGCGEALYDFLLDPRNYRNAFLPRHMMESALYTLSRMRKRARTGKFSEGDFNRWTFNHILAVHPVTRFLTAMLYKTNVDGRARLFYKDSKFLQDIKFKRLDKPGKPYIFHNAYNFRTHDVDLFANNSPRWGRKGHKPLTPQSLCACSALPFIEATVEVDGDIYCEGALVDTLNFKRLLQDHHNPHAKPQTDEYLNEIWVSRIVDVRQIRKPRNQHDAIGNLCQMFAATVGEDDIKLFKYHVRENYRKAKNGKATARYGKEEVPAWQGILVDIPVDDRVNFEWSHSNLDLGVARGQVAAEAAWKLYETYKGKPKEDGLLAIPDDLTDQEITHPAAGLTPEEISVVLRTRHHTTQQMGQQVSDLLGMLGLSYRDIEKVKTLIR